MEGHAKSAPISQLPLITIMDTKHYLKDFPVYEVRIYKLNPSYELKFFKVT